MENRSLILDTALRLFGARGYDAVGVQEIVETCGLTKPTLYHYFGSKRGLLDALLRQHMESFLVQAKEAADYRGDLPLTLTRIAQLYFADAQQNPAYYRLQLALWLAPVDSEGYQVVREFQRAQLDLVERVFALAVKDHGNMRGRQRAYAATFYGMLNTYISLALNQAVTLDDELVNQAVHQFQHGIYS